MARKKDDLAKGFAGPVLPKAPKRSAVPETEARRFERAPSPTVAPSSRLRRDERGERVSAYVPPEMAEALRVRCARERRSVSDAMTEALRLWLDGTKAPQR
jgi:hypothetical protein